MPGDELILHTCFAVLLVVAVTAAVRGGKLSIAAGIVAALLALAVYLGTAFSGIVLLGTFFITGVLATSWKKELKYHFHRTDPGFECRTAGQVVANGGITGLLALAALILPAYTGPLLLMMACSLSSATADTTSSELGVLYGKRFYNILTLKKDAAGENGVISVEGTLIGIAGSTLIAAVHALVAGFNRVDFMVIIIAGTLGNLVDSIAGAALERKELLSNNAVNLLNTFIAAAAGGVMYYLVSR